MTQIFIEPELQELEQIEISEQWLKMAEELGLDHQVRTAHRSPEKKPTPYMPVDEKTSRIIRTLCPTKTKFREYSASTIPLDVMQEISKAVKNNWFDEIYIYSDDKTPDPFVLGYLKSTYEYQLIARWGAELMPFELLEAKAIKILKTKAMVELTRLKTMVDIAMKNPELLISGMLNNVAEFPRVSFEIETASRW